MNSAIRTFYNVARALLNLRIIMSLLLFDGLEYILIALEASHARNYVHNALGEHCIKNILKNDTKDIFLNIEIFRNFAINHDNKFHQCACDFLCMLLISCDDLLQTSIKLLRESKLYVITIRYQ